MTIEDSATTKHSINEELFQSLPVFFFSARTIFPITFNFSLNGMVLRFVRVTGGFPSFG